MAKRICSKRKREDAAALESSGSNGPKANSPAEVHPAAAITHNIVTPGTRDGRRCRAAPEGYDEDKRKVRRTLFPDQETQRQEAPVTVPVSTSIEAAKPVSPTRRKLFFGNLCDITPVQDNVREIYAIVRKLTGSIGGNASHGPIYGELTMTSMQKMVNLMKEHTKFDTSSRFVDVGSGIGKPNLHVAQDPGVDLSYGIEVEVDRWVLSMSCLNGVFDAAQIQQASRPQNLSDSTRIHTRCIFEHADIRKSRSFDPFTHVYMFSIGYVRS